MVNIDIITIYGPRTFNVPYKKQYLFLIVLMIFKSAFQKKIFYGYLKYTLKLFKFMN